MAWWAPFGTFSYPISASSVTQKETNRITKAFSTHQLNQSNTWLINIMLAYPIIQN